MEEISEVATVPHVCDQPEAVGEVIPSQCDLVPQGRSSPRGEDEAQSDVPVPPLELVGAPTVSHGSSEAAAFKAETIVVEATLHLKTPCAKELVANDSFSFSEMIQTIFEIELGMKFSVTSAGSVKVISATAIRISLSTPGCDLVAARILSWASKMADVLQHWLADHELGYTISSVDVKSISPIQQNSMKNGDDENNNYDKSDETKCVLQHHHKQQVE